MAAMESPRTGSEEAVINYRDEDRITRRHDFVFKALGVVLLCAICWGWGYETGRSDTKAAQAITAEHQSGGSRR